MLEAAEADLALEAGFVQCEGAPGIPENLAAKFVDANKRRFEGFAMAASVLSLAVRLTELHRSWDRTPFGHAHDAAGCI